MARLLLGEPEPPTLVPASCKMRGPLFWSEALQAGLAKSMWVKVSPASSITRS